MRLLSGFFYFVLTKPDYGVLSDPPSIVSRHPSRLPLINVFKNNGTTGVLEYDSNKGLYQTVIIQNGRKKKLFSWPHSSVIDRFIDSSSYLKLDILGNMIRLDIDSEEKRVWTLGVQRGDYLTCANFWKQKGLVVSFHNHFYIFDEKEATPLQTLSLDTNQFLYATKMRSFWQREGPVHVLIRFQKGGFIYLRFLDVVTLKDVKILEKTLYSFEDAVDFDLDDRFIYVLDMKNRLVISSLKDRNKTFIIPLRTSFLAICVRDREIHLFDPKKECWSTIRPTD